MRFGPICGGGWVSSGLRMILCAVVLVCDWVADLPWEFVCCQNYENRNQSRVVLLMLQRGMFGPRSVCWIG